MAKQERLESSLLRTWHTYFLTTNKVDSKSHQEAWSGLAYLMASFLNLYMWRPNSNTIWEDHGADDLLDAVYESPQPTILSASGLMCWGDEDVYLTPFNGEFTSCSSGIEIVDFTLKFATDTRSPPLLTIPFTHNKQSRLELLEQGLSLVDSWPTVFLRSN